MRKSVTVIPGGRAGCFHAVVVQDGVMARSAQVKRWKKTNSVRTDAIETEANIAT
jgi:hypothetical protein